MNGGKYKSFYMVMHASHGCHKQVTLYGSAYKSLHMVLYAFYGGAY